MTTVQTPDKKNSRKIIETQTFPVSATHTLDEINGKLPFPSALLAESSEKSRYNREEKLLWVCTTTLVGRAHMRHQLGKTTSAE